MEQHALVVMVVILLRHLFLSVTEPLPQLLVHNFLNLQEGRKKLLLVKCKYINISFPFGGVNFVLFDTLSKSHCVSGIQLTG